MPAKARYEIIPKLLTSEVNPGKSIEVEAYITGAGSIHANKLTIAFPSAITDDKNPGEVSTSVKAAIHKSTGETLPLAGKAHTQTAKCDKFGITIGLAQGYFLDNPHLKNASESTLPVKVGEGRFDDLAPIKLTLNTRKHAPPGNYEIRFVLTYSIEDEIETSKELVNVHVTSWTERHGKITAIIGIGLAALASAITIIAYVK